MWYLKSKSKTDSGVDCIAPTRYILISLQVNIFFCLFACTSPEKFLSEISDTHLKPFLLMYDLLLDIFATQIYKKKFRRSSSFYINILKFFRVDGTNPSPKPLVKANNSEIQQ